MLNRNTSKKLQKHCLRLGETFVTADNLIDATNNTDGFADVSGALKVTALVLIKMANDFRMMASALVAVLMN